MSNKYLDIAMEKVIKQEVNAMLKDIKAEIKEWYWQADKQAIAKDPCVVDAMIDLFIRTINAHISGEPQESDHKCHTCKHYTSGERDGSCGSYICKGYSNWESEVQDADSN